MQIASYAYLLPSYKREPRTQCKEAEHHAHAHTVQESTHLCLPCLVRGALAGFLSRRGNPVPHTVTSLQWLAVLSGSLTRLAIILLVTNRRNTAHALGGLCAGQPSAASPVSHVRRGLARLVRSRTNIVGHSLRGACLQPHTAFTPASRR